SFSFIVNIFFFFQAEDGIRDYKVTGVQTCALPILALLVAIAALLVLAPVLRTPYPILLVLGGLALGFVPGIPTISLPPDIVLVAILPPLLYSAAFYTSLRDLRQNVIPISALAIGLVAATTV